MKLFYEILGEGEPLVILHGLLGSSDNWKTLGKKWSHHFKVILLDLANHGNSPHNDEISYQLMAEDVIETTKYLGLKHFHLLGHSMGGKVAMVCSRLISDSIQSLNIVDIAPKAYPSHFQAIFEAMLELDISGDSRIMLDEALTKKIADSSTRQFLLKNLRRNKKEGSGFTWKVNLTALSKNIEVISDWVFEENKNKFPSKTLYGQKALYGLKALYSGPTQFLIGENSSYVVKEDTGKITTLFPRSQIITIKGAGHWIHAQKPAEIEQLVSNFIKKIK